jgi:hypothetical protein
MPRVRSSDSLAIATLLQDAMSRSATFRQLVAIINATNGIVYISPGKCRPGFEACLLISVIMAGPNRVLTVHVDPSADSETVISSIGHELQHASEALSEAGVISGPLLYAFFERLIGGPTARGELVFETENAVRAAQLIRRELESFRAARHVRSTEVRFRKLVDRGEVRSPTFHRLMDRLDTSDVVVYLEPKQKDRGLDAYSAHHLTIDGPYRHIRVPIEVQGTEDRVIGVIGHELQHAAEVAQSPEIRDDVGVRRFFERAALPFGCGGGRECYETQTARDVEESVLAELKRSLKR